MKLLNLNKRVKDLLQITKLYTVFDVHEDEAARHSQLLTWRAGVLPAAHELFDLSSLRRAMGCRSTMAHLTASVKPPVHTMSSITTCPAAMFQDFAEGELREQPLAHRLGYARFMHQPRQIGHAIRLNDVFHPEHVVGFQGPGDGATHSSDPSENGLRWRYASDRRTALRISLTTLRPVSRSSAERESPGGPMALSSGRSGIAIGDDVRSEAIPRPDLHLRMP